MFKPGQTGVLSCEGWAECNALEVWVTGFVLVSYAIPQREHMAASCPLDTALLSLCVLSPSPSLPCPVSFLISTKSLEEHSNISVIERLR